MSLSKVLSRFISTEMRSYLDRIIQQNRVIVFIKGTAEEPRCSFSKNAVELIKKTGIKEFATVNVLEDDELRSSLKEFSNWPTIPQLYVNGKFIGGNDVMIELSKTSEFDELMNSEQSAAEECKNN